MSLAPAGMDYIVAGCHDSTVHIYHFKQQRKSGVELQAGGQGPVGWHTSGLAAAGLKGGAAVSAVCGNSQLWWCVSRLGAADGKAFLTPDLLAAPARHCRR